MKAWLWRGAGAAAVISALSFLVVVSGVVPIKASSGHWPITEWFLHFAMQRSVATHSFILETPELNDERLVVRGAGHYDLGCRSCHGSPEHKTPVIAQKMTPDPPELGPVIANWDEEGLFQLVKHGVKFTGMPAWPTLVRDDEVWAVVAFLLRLPNMTAAEYARLARGTARDATEGSALATMAPLSPNARDAVRQSCARCHGFDGLGRNGAHPRIAGQKPAYLAAALHAYARSERHSGIMQPVAASLDAALIDELAQYYAKLKLASGELPMARSANFERGRAIAMRGIPEKKVPPCAECHGPGSHPRNPFYPNLAGQDADYLITQLQLFKSNQRGGSRYAHLMRHVAPYLSDAQMRDVAAYYGYSANEARN